jgi:colicin import membrane protein
MARKLKTYQTSLGFYDLALAAPSMKAALEAWGAESNLFHQGAAKESDDPDVIAATTAKPGVILRRAVGSNGPFTEHAALPTNLSDEVNGRPKRPKPRKQPPRKTDDKTALQAALEYERTERQRESERRKEQAAGAKERARREQATAMARGALEKAKREHDANADTIKAERDALEKRSQAEDARWDKQKEVLETALRRARD